MTLIKFRRQQAFSFHQNKMQNLQNSKHCLYVSLFTIIEHISKHDQICVTHINSLCFRIEVLSLLSSENKYRQFLKFVNHHY